MNWSKKDIQNLRLKSNLKVVLKKNNILSQKHLIKGKISVEKALEGMTLTLKETA